MEDLYGPRMVLRLLSSRTGMTQAEVGQALGLTPGTLSLHFQRLEYEGLIRRERVSAGGRGRPREQWFLWPERNFTITLVFDLPRLDARLNDFDDEVHVQQSADLRTFRSRRKILQWIDAFIVEATKHVQKQKGRLWQCFAGLPGVLDAENGRVITSSNMPVLNGLDLETHISEQFNVPLHANSLGIPYYFGEQVDFDSDQTALVIYWDMGVGMIAGQGQQLLTIQGLPEGQSRAISEIGHIAIAKNGLLCHCGRCGCLEAYTGGWALLRDLQDAGIKSLEDLIERAEARDPVTRKTVSRALRLMGEHLYWPMQLLGVQRVRVTGILAPLAARYGSAFRRGLARKMDADEVGKLVLDASPQPVERLMTGASRVARRAFFFPDEFARLPRMSATMAGRRLQE